MEATLSTEDPPTKGHYTEYITRYYSKDRELIEIFNELFEKVYHITPKHYVGKKDGSVTATVRNKGVFYDLNSLNLKPEAFEFHVPKKYLDDEGKKVFLKGFFFRRRKCYFR